jgi:hypothetical protein
MFALNNIKEFIHIQIIDLGYKAQAVNILREFKQVFTNTDFAIAVMTGSS